MWLSHAPQAYGLGSGLWQASMVCKMMLDRLGIDIRPRTLRATLHRMGLSFRRLREVPHKSADPETCKKFIGDAQKRMDALARAGYTNFYEDEETVLLAVLTGRGWLPRGGRETIKTTFSRRSLKVFGALGRDVLHVMAAHSTKSEVFKIFLEALRQKYGRVAFVTDNAGSHKSKLIREYLESTGGDVVLICLPQYIPQLNPIEIQWQMIKARLAARYHSTGDEMERSIVRLAVRRGAARPDIRPADGLMREQMLYRVSKDRPGGVVQLDSRADRHPRTPKHGSSVARRT